MTAQDEELAAIAAAATAAAKQYNESLESIFVDLQRADPVIADALVETFGDAGRGMWWLVQVPVFGQDSPCALLARGKREAVLETLTRICHGVYF